MNISVLASHAQQARQAAIEIKTAKENFFAGLSELKLTLPIALSEFQQLVFAYRTMKQEDSADNWLNVLQESEEGTDSWLMSWYADDLAKELKLPVARKIGDLEYLRIGKDKYERLTKTFYQRVKNKTFGDVIELDGKDLVIGYIDFEDPQVRRVWLFDQSVIDPSK